MTYADTSFLSSCYIDDEQSEMALVYVESHRPRLPFTFLHWPEMSKATLAKSSNADKDWEKIKTDVSVGKKLFAAPMDADRVGRRAAGLMWNYYARWNKLRSLDAMHVAAAVEGGFKTFLSFDSNSYQRLLAHTQRLSVWPPLTDDEKKRLK